MYGKLPVFREAGRRHLAKLGTVKSGFLNGSDVANVSRLVTPHCAGADSSRLDRGRIGDFWFQAW